MIFLVQFGINKPCKFVKTTNCTLTHCRLQYGVSLFSLLFISVRRPKQLSSCSWQKINFLNLLIRARHGPFVIRPFNFCLKSKLKIDVNFWFFFKFCYQKKYESAKSKIFDIFFLSVEYWNITHIFTSILSTMRRKIKLSGNFASPTMLQSVAWLSFSVFGGSLKFENWKLQSIFNFCFSDKTFQIVDGTTQEGGGGVH